MGYASAEQLALVRVAAEEAIAEGTGQAGGSALALAAARGERWVREYVQRARATLACLDWIEGRRDGAPSSGKLRRVTEDPRDGLNQEIGEAEDLLRAAQRPGSWAEFYWHDTVWGALTWYRNPREASPPITVPGVSPVYD